MQQLLSNRKVKVILWALSVNLCLIIQLRGQTVHLRSAVNQEPIAEASILCNDPFVYAQTDEEGRADLSAFRDCKVIEISVLGFENHVLSYEQILGAGLIILLEPSSFNLDEIVVSASKWYRSSLTVPSKIEVINPEVNKLQNPQTAADLLASSDKVYMQKSQQGGGSPMIRGFATNRLLYSVDGIRMNTAIFRGGNIQNIINLDAFSVESAEVLFGPGSIIYGSDAIGGVMSFKTLTPSFSPKNTPKLKGSATLRVASASDEVTGHADFGIGWKKWALVTSVSRWQFDDLKQGSHGPEDYIKDQYVDRINGEDIVVAQEDRLLQIPSAYDQRNLLQKIRFQPNKNWEFNYGFHYSETSSYGRYDRHNRTRNGQPRYGEWNYGPQLWMMNNLQIDHAAQSALFDQLAIRIAWQRFEESRISRNFNDVQREIREEEVDAYSWNLDLIKSIGEKHTLSYGAEFVWDDVHSVGTEQNIETNVSQPGPSRYPESSWSSYALYVSDQIRVMDKLNLQAGARYNFVALNADFDTTFYPFPFTEAKLNNGALTGSIGAVYQPTSKWVLSANLATAFRAPNVDDMGKVFDSEPGAVTVPNPDLKPEYAYNLDVGMTTVLSNKLKIDFAAYYTILNDALVRRDYELEGQDSIIYDGENSRVQAIQNAAMATVYGLQFGFDYTPILGLTLSSSLNYQHGEEELDDGSTSPSRHAAPLFGATRLKYKRQKYTLEAYVSYQGEVSHDDLAFDERGKDEMYAKDENGNNYAPSWYTLNLKVLYKISDLISLTGGVENITDQRYRSYSSGISAPGRNYILALRVDF